MTTEYVGGGRRPPAPHKSSGSFKLPPEFLDEAARRGIPPLQACADVINRLWKKDPARAHQLLWESR